MIVRDFQSVIGREARQQILEKEGRLPDAVLACVGGGSNAMGIFHEFIPDEGVQLIGCEAAGKGVDTAMNAATMTCGSEGVFHGMKSYFCQNEFGRLRRYTPSAPGWTTRVLGRSTPTCTILAVPNMCLLPTTRR